MEYVIVVFILIILIGWIVTAEQQRYSGPGEKADVRLREVQREGA